jgi:hypothetical protein
MIYLLAEQHQPYRTLVDISAQHCSLAGPEEVTRAAPMSDVSVLDQTGRIRVDTIN